MPQLNLGVVGYGYWGPNLARNLDQLEDARVVAICDESMNRLGEARRSHPHAVLTDNLDLVLADNSVDAVVLATPAATHWDLGRRILDAGKHLLVEKPLAMTVAESAALIAMAEARSRTLMVGHTFLYNSAVRYMQALIDRGELGDVFYLYSQRLNLGKIRQDVNAMWNLAPHDVSVLLYLMDEDPVAVRAQGHAYVQPEMHDVVFLTMEFANGRLGHVHVSWLDPQKVRRITVVGSRKMVVFDDVNVDARIQIYDKGIDFVSPNGRTAVPFDNLGEFQLLLRSGDLLVPQVSFHEPLRVECQEFVDAIREGRPPLTDGRDGLRTVQVLEAAQRSLESGGRRVELQEITEALSIPRL